MFSAMVQSVGRLVLLAATAAFLTAVSLLIFSSFLMTWPLLRKSPRERKLIAAAELASAGLTLLGTLQTPKS